MRETRPTDALTPGLRDSYARPGLQLFLRRLAAEVRRIVDAALPRVAGDLRIGTERPCARRLAVHDLAGDDGVRRLPLLHPVDDGRDRIVLIGTDAAAAMRHAGHHEQAEEIGRLAAVLLDRLLVVIHAHHRLENRIGPAVGHDQLAAAL